VRKFVMLKEREIEGEWPTKQIEDISIRFFNYLQDYIAAGVPAYSKHAIMGPAGKVLSAVEADGFGENVESYVGFIANIHDQTSEHSLSSTGMQELKNGVEGLLQLRRVSSQRMFHRYVRAVDYDVFYRKIKQIRERSEAKKEASKD